MCSFLTVSFSDKVVDQKCIFVLSLEFLLTEITNSFKSLFLDSLKDLIFRLIVLVDRLEDLNWVSFSAGFKLLQGSHVELLALDGRNDLIVEKGHLPLILMEQLWEILEVAFSLISYVLHRQQTLNIALRLILLHEDGLEE